MAPNRLLASICVAMLFLHTVGCAATRWTTGSASDVSTVHEALILTSDLALHVSGAQIRDGRVHGRVLDAWRLPAGVAVIVDDSGASPTKLARRLGWQPASVPKQLDLAYDEIQSTRVPKHESRYIVQGFVAVLGVLVLVGVVILIVKIWPSCPRGNQGPIGSCR